MKIVWVTGECPYPANTGGRVGVWKRIEYISEKHDIYLFTIMDSVEEYKCIDEMENFCKKVYMYERNRNFKVAYKLLKYPYPAVSRWNDAMTADIEKLAESLHPDYVVVDCPQMMGVLSTKTKDKFDVILNQHNIEFQALRSIGRRTKNPIKKMLYFVTSVQMKRYESKIYKEKKVSLYTFVSSADKDFFESNFDSNNTLLVPVGAELQFDSLRSSNHTMIFVAKMSYQSNEDGAIWLLNSIWDKILSKISDAKLYLVGKDPSDKLIMSAREHESVTVTGTVDDLDTYYSKTNLVVVPILSGGGVKVKLLEALGHGKIVVTTTKGMEGTNFVNQVHLIATDDENEFADACVSIMQNPQEYSNMQSNSIKLMEKEYSWKGVVDVFERKLLEMKSKEREQ